MLMLATSPLTVPDYRRRGQSLPPVSLRLPPEMVSDLDNQADRLKTTRAGLVRALVARGLAQLEEVTVAK
jgi:hypothetical protein